MITHEEEEFGHQHQKRPESGRPYNMKGLLNQKITLPMKSQEDTEWQERTVIFG